MTQTKKEEKENVVTEITHANNTQEDCVDESSHDCAARLDPLRYSSDMEQSTQDHYPSERDVNKMALRMHSDLFLSATLLARDQLQPERPLRMNPTLPQ